MIRKIYIIFSLFTLLILLGAAPRAQAQVFTHRLPIYIVNGERMDEQQVRAIDPEDIVSNELLPADDATIAKYGQDAANGVIVITLRYDTEARFEVDGQETNFSQYIARQIKWGEMEPIAQVVMKLEVGPDGVAREKEVLESSDRKLLKRIRTALSQAPRWVAAQKDGKGITTEHLLRITLPIGSKMPREWAVIIR
jgi:hypothetical protein